ncbi:recombination regulator RecX [Vagococcus vulneris]|uniref:Regulatory protein RecX n=1 Tax=Vagococcus vulneris TaxID=1977869 RepID=A0A429ZZV1_9ENTE|nr:recombination regulator RecX [Vagococcus vulneris]RST99582.1 recombination regulator RecX [Vagococcus vulneris]
MEIIALVKKLKGQNYRVRTESGLSFDVSEDAIVRHRLLKGEELNHVAIEAVRQEAAMTVGYQKALYYLNTQLRSEKEVRDYLVRKEIDEGAIPNIIQRLKDLTLINDLLYAESYVRTMIRTSDKGPIVVRQQLKRRGIQKNFIVQALAQYSFDDQTAIAMHVAEKAMRKYVRKSHQEQKDKTRQQLFTKGFEADVIQLVMSELSAEKDTVAESALLKTAGDKLWHKHRKVEGYKRKQKVIASLMQKGFSYDDIQHYLREKELEESE